MSYVNFGAVRTCNVDTGSADRMYSQRHLSSSAVSCPTVSNVDMYGRTVCPDTLRVEVAGCRHPTERIDIENNQRPSYYEFVNLDGHGLRGNLYSAHSASRTNMVDNVHRIVGNSGIDYGNTLQPRCSNTSYRAVNSGNLN